MTLIWLGQVWQIMLEIIFPRMGQFKRSGGFEEWNGMGKSPSIIVIKDLKDYRNEYAKLFLSACRS